MCSSGHQMADDDNQSVASSVGRRVVHVASRYMTSAAQSKTSRPSDKPAGAGAVRPRPRPADRRLSTASVASRISTKSGVSRLGAATVGRGSSAVSVQSSQRPAAAARSGVLPTRVLQIHYDTQKVMFDVWRVLCHKQIVRNSRVCAQAEVP